MEVWVDVALKVRCPKCGKTWIERKRVLVEVEAPESSTEKRPS